MFTEWYWGTLAHVADSVLVGRKISPQKDGFSGEGGVGTGLGPSPSLTDWTGTTEAELDLAEFGHAIIVRCRIVFIFKTVKGNFDA